MIRKQLGIFLIVGILTVLIDYLTYRTVAGIGLIETNQAKITGFLTGTLLTYFANRRWTFSTSRHAGGSVWRFAFLYALTLMINTSANAIMLQALSELQYAVLGAFFIATGLSATINFLGMKHFVFVRKKQP